MMTLSLLAYIGPGAGLGMLGSLIAVILAIAVALLGLLLYPVTLIYRMCRKDKNKDDAPASEPKENQNE